MKHLTKIFSSIRWEVVILPALAVYVFLHEIQNAKQNTINYNECLESFAFDHCKCADLFGVKDKNCVVNE